ncbi:MAG: AMP-binding protein [Saprospiraceae bacterium]
MEIKSNIVDLLFDAAKCHPDRNAIIYREQCITFARLANDVNSTANYFQIKGIGKGDRVLVFVPMSIDLYRIVLALFRIGAVAVFLDEWVSKERLEICCKIANCKAFVAPFKIRMLSIFSKELRRVPIKLGLSFDESSYGETFPSVDMNDTALVTFTTGSTGIPKAAKRTHGFLQAQFAALADKVRMNDGEVSMPVLPIVLLINLGNGTTSVIADFKASKPDSLEPDRIIKQIQKYGVHQIISSPFFIQELSSFLLDNQLSLPNVIKIITGGAPVFPNQAKHLLQAFDSAEIEIVYGSTESEPISSISAKDLVASSDKNQFLGLNTGRVDNSANVKIIRIVDAPLDFGSMDELRQFEVPLGEIGEIIVSGYHVLREYLHNPEAIKRNKIFIGNDCWHRTGDSGYLDAEGNLFLTGRSSTLIYMDDQLISPFVYENHFQKIDGVDCGTLMQLKGQLFAIIHLQDNADKEMVTDKINQLPAEIDRIHFVKEIPKDKRHRSKIEYEKLRQIVDQLD